MCAPKPVAGCHPVTKGGVCLFLLTTLSHTHTLGLLSPVPYPIPFPLPHSSNLLSCFHSIHSPPPPVSCSLTFLAMRGFSGLSFTETVSLYSGMRSRSRGRLTVTTPVWDVSGWSHEQAPTPPAVTHGLPSIPRWLGVPSPKSLRDKGQRKPRGSFQGEGNSTIPSSGQPQKRGHLGGSWVSTVYRYYGRPGKQFRCTPV